MTRDIKASEAIKMLEQLKSSSEPLVNKAKKLLKVSCVFDQIIPFLQLEIRMFDEILLHCMRFIDFTKEQLLGITLAAILAGGECISRLPDMLLAYELPLNELEKELEPLLWLAFNALIGTWIPKHLLSLEA